MWKKLLITGCVTFSLLSGGTLSAQPSCEIKEEVTSEQLDSGDHPPAAEHQQQHGGCQRHKALLQSLFQTAAVGVLDLDRPF